MKWISIILAVILVMPLVLGSLNVEKIVDNDSLNTGDDLTVKLKLTNDFDQDVKVTIKDNNIIDGKGLEIQCLEKTIPANKETTITQESFEVYSAGDFELGSASVSFQNPETGDDEEIESNTVDIKVSGDDIAGSGSIKSIYECNNQRIVYQSSSSNSGMQIQIGSSMGQQESQQEQQQTSQDMMDQKMQAAQNNQMPQNPLGMKKEIQENMQKEEQEKGEFQQNLQNSEEMQNMMQQMENNGYSMKDMDLNPDNATDGNFSMRFQNMNGDQINAEGSMKNGDVDVKYPDPEELQKQIDSIKNSEKFKKYENQLQKEGYNFSNMNASMQGNKTKVNFNYNNTKNNNNATITAEIEGNKARLELKKDEEKNKNYIWWALALILLAVGMYFILRKKIVKEEMIEEEVIEEEKFDYIEYCRKVLDEAAGSYDKDVKEAHVKLVDAVKTYIIYSHDLGKEMTNSEILESLKEKGEKKLYDKFKEGLDYCSIVEFAKGSASRKKFDSVAGSVKDLLK